jgi:hypothetical protein
MAVRCHELFILYKKNKKKLRFKNIISFYKLISKSFEFGYNTYPKIILIITLNLYDLSLSEFGYNTRPNSFGCGSGYKVVS